MAKAKTPKTEDQVTETPEVKEEAPQLNLEGLKEQADILGIKYHPKIGAVALAEKLKDATMSKTQVAEEDENGERAKSNEDILKEKGGRKKLLDQAMRLVRINVTCMNPAKKELPGDFISVGNSVVPTQRRYIPFNTTDGWHVPHIMYETLKEKECQVFVTEKAKNGQTVRRGKQIREYAIEVMDPLTPAELKELAQRQAMKRGEG